MAQIPQNRQFQEAKVPPHWGAAERRYAQGVNDLLERLFYMFGRLSADDLGKPLRKQLTDTAGNLLEIRADVDNVTLTLSTVQGDVSSLTLTTQEFATRITNAEGDLSALEQTAQQFGVRLQNAEDDVTILEATAQGLQTSVTNLGNTKNRTYINAIAPSVGLIAGDLWIDTANGNLLKRWNGSSWVAVQDGAISLAQQMANKIAWIIASGDSASNMELTDRLYSLVTNRVMITAQEQINLSVADKATITMLDQAITGIAENISLKADKLAFEAARDNLQAQISAVPGQIELAVGAVQVGGRNLIKNSDWSQGLTHEWINFGLSNIESVSITGWTWENKPTTRIWAAAGGAGMLYQDVPVQLTKNTDFIASVQLRWNVTVKSDFGDGAVLNAQCFDAGGTAVPGGLFGVSASSLTSDAFQRVELPFTAPGATAKIRFSVRVSAAGASNNYAAYQHAQLEQGNTITPWKLAEEDPASGVKTSKVTIDGTGIAMTTGGTFTVGSQNFNIDAAGNVTMKGQVEASAGKIGGFTISGNKLVDTATGGTKAQIDPTTGTLILNDLEITQEDAFLTFRSRFVNKLRYFNFMNPNGGIILQTFNPNQPPGDETWMTRFDIEMPTAAKPDGRTYNYGDSYIAGNCSALSFTDRTPAYFGDALDELRWTSGSRSKGIDHSSIPKFAQKKVLATRLLEDGSKEEYEEEARDLGAMVSVLTRAVQQLTEITERQQKQIDQLSGGKTA